MVANMPEGSIRPDSGLSLDGLEVYLFDGKIRKWKDDYRGIRLAVSP
jgi:hypothetical protein